MSVLFRELAMADILVWTEKCSVGNDLMDEQHKQIISLINLLSGYPNERVDSEEISVVLDRLWRYIKTHLAAEESLMKQIGYPYLDEHEKIHHAYIERYVELVYAVTRHEKSAPEQLIQFLREWWTNHIRSEDMKYRPYL